MKYPVKQDLKQNRLKEEPEVKAEVYRRRR